MEIASSSNLQKMNLIFRSKPVILYLIFMALVLLILTVVITAGSTERTTYPYSNIWFITRELWQGLDPLKPLPLNDPALFVVIKHTGGASCTDFKTCSTRVREIQKEDMKKFPDIKYNFLIGGDDRIYEGRGWLVQNEEFRSESVDIAFIGNFTTDVPSAVMLSRALYLVSTGVDQNKINYVKYCVMAHNHTKPTDSPGKNVYKLLRKTFLHFSTEICYEKVNETVVPTDTCLC